MNLRLSPAAQLDIDEIHDWLASRSTQGLFSVLGALNTSFAQLERFPLMGRPGRVSETRELAVLGTPYVIVYSLPDAIHIDVERILHGRQIWPHIED